MRGTLTGEETVIDGGGKGLYCPKCKSSEVDMIEAETEEGIAEIRGFKCRACKYYEAC